MLQIQWRFFVLHLAVVDAGLLKKPANQLATPLYDDTVMPMIGYGTWRIPKNETEAAVHDALCVAGYRHIDAAQIYGNQLQVGEAIRRAIKEGCIKREDLWVTSKIWYTDFHPGDVPVAVDRILHELALDYIDQILLHWPTPVKKPPKDCPPNCPSEFAGTDDPMRPRDAQGNLVASKVPLRQTWMALEKVYKSGKVKSIGVSNFGIEDIDSIMKESDYGEVRKDAVKPAVNQVECHVFWNQEYLMRHHEYYGIQIVAYSPLGNRERHPYGHNSTLGITSKLIQEVAAEARLTPGQVMLNFLLMQRIVAIPKSTNPKRMKENIDFKVGMASPLMHRLMEAPQARLSNPPNRPGGKPVFDDTWIEQAKANEPESDQGRTDEELAHMEKLARLAQLQETRGKIGGVLEKTKEHTGLQFDTKTMLDSIMDTSKPGPEIQKISGSSGRSSRFEV